LKTLAVEGPVTLHVARLHWQKGDRELEVPAADWRLGFTVDGERRSLHSSVAMERLDYAAGDVEISVHGLDDELDTSISGDLRQDLGKLWREPRQLSGRGLASLELRISSGNFRVFHGLAALRVSGVDLKLPGYRVESLDGEIPLSGDFVFDPKGLRLLQNTPLNAYSELRFSDQNPLMLRQSFVTVAKLETPLGTLAPLTGNLRIENNLFALNQL